MTEDASRQRRVAGFIAFITIILAWSTFLIFVGPTYLIEAIGVENGYVLGFLVAAIGGVSTVTSFTYYTIVTILAAGGLNPFLLGVIMGSGVTVGDTIFFYLGKTGRHTVTHRFQDHIDDALDWAYKQRLSVVHSLVFIWAAFTPLPNDILTVSAGVGRFKARNIIPFLLLGNIVFTTLLALVVRYGFV